MCTHVEAVITSVFDNMADKVHDTGGVPFLSKSYKRNKRNLSNSSTSPKVDDKKIKNIYIT
jgi:hypothetical protein